MTVRYKYTKVNKNIPGSDKLCFTVMIDRIGSNVFYKRFHECICYLSPLQYKML